jgi:hypothetical protein
MHEHHPQDHPHAQVQFDALCAQVDDYETLPEIAPGPGDSTPRLSMQDHFESLDGEILSGLVSP